MVCKSDTLNLRVTPGFKELVRTAAERNSRSISNLIEVLVQEHCRRNGIEVPETKPSDLAARKRVGA